MHIKSVELTKFKRFSHLTVTDIPATAKLIILVGPNGCGKTSFFEAFNHWYQLSGFGQTGSQDYIEKKGEITTVPNGSWYQNKVKIDFYDVLTQGQSALHGKFYFRSAYRNEADFNISKLEKQTDPTQSIALQTLMLTDQTVSKNYQRLVARTMAGVYDSSNNEKTVETLRNEIIGKIKESLSNIFLDLNLNSIGDPLTNGSFYFEKGTSKEFHYKNLSAGEKSAFDLVLDIIIKSHYFTDAVYCIDEPEAHMHTRLQGKVLNELYQLVPVNSQLWISTHSIGMLKEAEKIEAKTPGSVVFLDFDGRDFDSDEIITPTKINKAVMDKFYDLAFGDFAQLIAPKQIVFCEGTQKGRKYKDFDAQIYGKIFEDKYPDTKFISLGSCEELIKIDSAVGNIVSSILKSSKVLKLIDRDDRSASEIRELSEKGINVTTKRHIECYLLDDTIIAKLCESLGQQAKLQECLNAKQQAVADSVQRGNPDDDIKSASGVIYTELKRILSLTQCGNNSCAFLRDTMSSFVTEETGIYQQLEQEIFTATGATS